MSAHSSIPTIEILKLLAAGLSCNQIGKQLGMGHTTVSKRLRKAGHAVPQPNAERYAHISDSAILSALAEELSQRKAAKRLGMNPSSLRARAKKAGYVAPKPERLSPKEVAVCRLDPAWEARRGIWKRVVCRECGEFKAELNANGEHSHLRTHKITGKGYRSKWPGARFHSFEKAAKLAVRGGYDPDVETAVQRSMKEFADRYVTRTELIQCSRNRDWEEQHDTSVVVCRRCGFKSKVHLYPHLKLHGYLKPSPTDAYRADYPKAPVEPIDLKTGPRKDYAKQRYAKKAQASRKVRRGSLPRPEEDKAYFRIGTSVEKNIPAAQKQTRHSIVAARQAVAIETRLEFDVVAQYHKRFRRRISGPKPV